MTDFEIIHVSISLSWTLSKSPNIFGIFGDFSFYVMNDISQLITALHIFNDTWTEDINISKYSH